MKPVVIACGGRGTRLGAPVQKCATIVHGRPFIHWKLDQLVEHGATEFYLLVRYRWIDIASVVGHQWRGRPVHFRFDHGGGPHVARRDAAAAGALPFIYWFTYGDCLLDVPLRDSKTPYVYTNDEFPDDAGTMYCWGQSFLFLRKRVAAPSYHINTPDDMERTDAYLRRHRQPGISRAVE